MALSNAQRQAKHRAKRPVIYDINLDAFRPATQADVDLLVQRCAAAVDLRLALLTALDLPINAHDQVAKLNALGGIYGKIATSAASH